MQRRQFLKILPLSAIAPKIVKDGVLSLELPKGHYVILADMTDVDIEALSRTPGILPPGSTGGCIIGTRGNPDEHIKFYCLKESDAVQP